MMDDMYEDMRPVLRTLHQHHIINELEFMQNDNTVRGSDNHKRGIIRLLEGIKTEKFVLLDSDCMVLHRHWLERLQDALQGASLAGVRHTRGYIHPSLLIASTAFVRSHQNEIQKPYERSGDTLECLSKYTQPIYLQHEDICGIHRISCNGVDIADHYVSDTNKRKTVDLLKQNYPAVMIIPVYGKYDKAIENLIDIEDIKTRIVCGNCGYPTMTGVDVRYPYDMPSRGILFNHGFLAGRYAIKYIFQDRDLYCSDKSWINSMLSCKNSYGMCYSNVEYDGAVVPDATGGSVFFDWSAYVMIGGFHSQLKGWGFEDREIMYRANAILGKPVRLPFKFVHCQQVESIMKNESDEIRERMREQVNQGNYQISTSHLWQELENIR
jgi:hypothetical protein